MPINENRRQAMLKWGLIFAAWTVLALLFSAPDFIHAVRVNRTSAGWVTVGAELIFSYFWLGLTPLALWLSRTFRIEGKKKFRSLRIHLLAGGLFLLLHSALFFLISIPIGWYAEITPLTNRYVFVVLAFAPVNVMFYWGIIIVDHAVDYYRRYQERELRASQLEAQLVQSELQVLKMQLHPHFLFNTLNTISALIHESPEEADEMISQLGDLLRLTLENVKVQEVPLAQELEFLNLYLAIEQTRFRDRLKVTMAIEPGTLDAFVPTLILQPLVENSIRHGIALRPEARSIEIKAWQEDSRLHLRVSDDGPGLIRDELPTKEGVGLKNTRARINSLYGRQNNFTLRNSPGGGLIVDLTIPFKTVALETREDD